jgi:hypothetical protein
MPADLALVPREEWPVRNRPAAVPDAEHAKHQDQETDQIREARPVSRGGHVNQQHQQAKRHDHPRNPQKRDGGPGIASLHLLVGHIGRAAFDALNVGIHQIVIHRACIGSDVTCAAQEPNDTATAGPAGSLRASVAAGIALPMAPPRFG